MLTAGKQLLVVLAVLGAVALAACGSNAGRRDTVRNGDTAGDTETVTLAVEGMT